jgi:hypothetical protein
MMIQGPSLMEFTFVCQNMRRKSAEELSGLYDWTPEQFARFLHSRDGFHWVGYCEGFPAALIGAYPQREGLWGLYGFGTNAWQKIWRSVTITAKRDMMQAVLATNARRADCLSLADHTESHKWLEYLGASHKAEMPQYGIKGQDYILFSWLRNS